jgi:predicted DCC family thiol-disulfide oxidoreductase YuxK
MRLRNPFACRGFGLPPELLLAGKVLALVILWTGFWRTFPEPFLPFVPGMDAFPAGVVRYGLTGMLVAGCWGLLLNVWVRGAAFVAGAAILLAIGSSRVYYGNNHLLAGLLLVLLGLYTERWGRALLRGQIALVYFGAGLNKLLDADWRSGRFFEYWATVTNPVAHLGEPWVAVVCSWGTIGIELGLAAGLLWPRTRRGAVWVSLLFHTALLMAAGKTFGLFYYAMAAAMLFFTEWPEERPVVIYDGDCGLCNATRRLVEWIDGDGYLDWRALQTGVGGRYGLAREALTEKLHVVAGARVWTGFEAVKAVAMWLPGLYLALAFAVMEAGRVKGWREGLVAVVLFGFSPLARSLGEWGYGVVARNRRRLWPGSQCEVSPKQ